MMINLLLIALEFPPIQAAGSFRPLRFVTHLPKFGIRPIVVTFDPIQLADGKVHVLNRALAQKVPVDVPIYLLDVAALEPGRAIERYAAASSGARFASLPELFARIRDTYTIDAVWATCPPFSVARLALAARDAFEKPLIVDMRDAWSQWGSVPFRTWFHYRRTLRNEVRLMSGADAVICVTPQLAQMQSRLTRNRRDHFHWIPNAYDFETMPATEVRLPAGKDRIRITYVGQFYFNGFHENPDGIIPWFKKKPHRWLHYYATQQRWIYRTPYFFLKAWAHLRNIKPSVGNRIEFHYIGYVPDWLPKMIETFGLTQFCTCHGYKPKAEAQNILEGSDALLSTSIKVVGGEDYCLASKTFDYIAAGKPVFGFVCPGTQREFLEASNISVLFDPDDADGSANKLAALLTNGMTQKIDHHYLATYSSLSTTGQLAAIVKKVSAAASKRPGSGAGPASSRTKGD